MHNMCVCIKNFETIIKKKNSAQYIPQVPQASVTAEQRIWYYTAPGELWNPTTVPTQSERQPFHWSSSRGAASAYGLRQGMAQNRSSGMLMDYGASYGWSERNPPWLPQVLRSEAILSLLWLDEQAAAAHSETALRDTLLCCLPWCCSNKPSKRLLSEGLFSAELLTQRRPRNRSGRGSQQSGQTFK